MWSVNTRPKPGSSKSVARAFGRDRRGMRTAVEEGTLLGVHRVLAPRNRRARPAGLRPGALRLFRPAARGAPLGRAALDPYGALGRWILAARRFARLRKREDGADGR